jgi:hypothetical protein
MKELKRWWWAMGRRIPKGCTEKYRSRCQMGGGDREKAGGRKGRERGGGKKLRGMGEDEPARYKECAAFKKGREKREGKGRAAHEEAKDNFPLFYFIIYLFLLICHPSFQAPPIAAGTLVLGPLLPSRSQVPFLPELPPCSGHSRGP